MLLRRRRALPTGAPQPRLPRALAARDVLARCQQGSGSALTAGPALPVPRGHTARRVSGSGCPLPQDALPLGSPFPGQAEGLRVSSLLF